MFRDKATRRRIKLARALERSAVPERPYIGRGPRYLVHPTITAACAPSLLAMAAALRDELLAFANEDLTAVCRFISDGSTSPYFGRDATAAMREAVRLQHLFIRPTAAVQDSAQVTPAESNVGDPSPALAGS